MIYHNTNVALVYGMPQNGKTNFAHYLKENVKDSIIFHVDTFFPNLENYQQLENDVYEVTSDHSFVYRKHKILHDMLQCIYETFQSMNHVSLLIIEGYSLVKMVQPIVNFFKELKINNVYCFDVRNKQIFIDDNYYDFEYGLNLVTSKVNINDSSYQSFDFLQSEKKDSDSLEKLYKSNILLYDLNDKTIVDVGCNAGYFLYQLHRTYDCKELIGIDNNEKWLKINYDINSVHFNTNKIKLYCDSYFNVKLSDIDLMFCFSTFHYFINQHVLFFEKANQSLNDDGVLIVEIETNPSSDNVLEQKIRPRSDSYLEYPSEARIIEIAKGFKLIKKEPSVFQGGQFYDRYFYHFIKTS